MKKLLLPVILALVGFVGGAGAGWFMKPAPPHEDEVCHGPGGETLSPAECRELERLQGEHEADGHEEEPSEFVTLDRQFIVPVVSDDKVASMIVLTLTMEVAPGSTEAVFQREPKLRDALLRALFEHAYTGGFGGDFTAERVMAELRRNLLSAARGVVGDTVRNVLVEDIIKQDQ